MNVVRFLWLEGRLSWPWGLWVVTVVAWLLRRAGWFPSPHFLTVLGEIALPLVGLLLVQRRWLQERLWRTVTLVPSVPFPQVTLWGLRLGLIAAGMSALGLAFAGLESYALWAAAALCLSGVSWLVTVSWGEGAGLGVGLGWWSWSVWLMFQNDSPLAFHDRWWSWFALGLVPLFEGWEDHLWARKRFQLLLGVGAYVVALALVAWNSKGLSAWMARLLRLSSKSR